MDIMEQLEMINRNLNTIIENQAILYCKIGEIEKEIRERKLK